MTPALAASTDNSVLDFSYADGAIGSIITFATGPIAQMIAVLSIFVAAMAFVRLGDKDQGALPPGWGEYGYGMKSLLVAVIGIGLLIGIANMFPSMAGACI